MSLREIVRKYEAGALSTTEVLTELGERAKLPLSEGQRALWVVHEMDPDTCSYNVPTCLVSDHIDHAALEVAFRDTLLQHPVLSVTIRKGDNGLYQSPEAASSFNVERVDISDIPSDGVLEYLQERAQRPFDLATGPLIRLSVMTRSESEVYVLMVIHHIIVDGPSLCTVFDTLLRYYNDRVSDEETAKNYNTTMFGEFVRWEKDYLDSAQAVRDRDYWKQELTGITAITGLPTEVTLSPDSPHIGAICTRRLTRDRADAIAAAAAANGIVPGAFLLAVFAVLIHRYTGQEDIVIGMPMSRRPSAHFESSVGYYVNTLPIRTRFSDSEEFTPFVKRVQSSVFEAMDHGSYPFANIVRDRNHRDNLRSPVCQVAYNFENFSISGHLKGLSNELFDSFSFRMVEGLHQLGENDLALHVVPDDGFDLHWKYNPIAFSSDTISRMADHFTNALNEILTSGVNTKLGQLDLLSSAERQLVLNEWNRTDIEWPVNQTVWDRFAKHADSGPDRPALSCGERTLTYRELADRSSALADELRHRGIAVGDSVGVCLERSIDLVVGLLAIMKAGAAYVPLDPDLPDDRLSYMIKDSRAALVVCDEAVLRALSTVPMLGVEFHLIDRQYGRNNTESPKPQAADRRSKAAKIAYTIYTSGSTGQPKGVVVSHRSLSNVLLSVARTLNVTPSDRIPAIATYSFDIAALEFFLPLITGGHCRIISSATVRDATLLAAELNECKPTIVQATPATWTMLIRVGWKNSCGARILSTGEALPESLKNRLVSLGEAWNLYGPTETTLYASMKRLRAEERVTIGSPIANTHLYVVDENMQPAPLGLRGELCISGHGVAEGYKDNPTLTAERFVTNPFVPGLRMYRTGDVARRLPNGEIEVLGRMDNQIKLRGYRIELGEIEAAINGYPAIAHSVAKVERKGELERIAAYFTVHGDCGSNLEIKTLRSYLVNTLPAYMVPSVFVALESFPMTANGKIDRALLSSGSDTQDLVAGEVTVQDAAASERHVEQAVRRIFSSALYREDIERHEGFFEAGGDSLTAINVVEEINRTFQCELRPTALFSHSTIAAMARYVALQSPTLVALPESAVNANTGKSVKAAPNDHAVELAGYGEYLDDSIAVVGISCEFPGSANHQEFWNNLQDGNTGSTLWSEEELRALGVPEQLIGGAEYVPRRAVIAGKAEFDEAFFGISPRDAALMDPQGRMLLMHAWKALEDAGYRPEDVTDTSVFTSVSNNFYQALLPSLMQNAAGPRVLADLDGYSAWLFAQGGSVPTMISHKLGLRGPSMAVNTNCSSALSGLYLAVQGLLSRDVRQALVGAASLFSPMELGYVHQQGLNFSSDGHCKAFDDAADGMAGGEGVGVVLIKRARDALADGDHIYCLIRGMAVNNDGGEKAGFYAPGIRGQVEAIRSALDQSRVNPESIRYVEAHGTGTKLGDPIEVEALTEAYRHYTRLNQYCAIGSVKSNIGHLDAAAGIASLIKVALGLHHNEFPRTLHCEVPNTGINWADSPFFVADRNIPLDGGAEPPRAGLSSFGVGGTNVHVILEQVGRQVLARPSDDDSSQEHLVVLSARSSDRLRVLARNLLAFLPEYRSSGGDLSSLAYTLQVGRRAMAARIAFVSDNLDTLTAQLRSYAELGVPEAVFEGTTRRSDDELIALFAHTNELQRLVTEWLENREWNRLAPLWVNGIDVDWNAHREAQKPGRVSLPTYPFDTKPFWPASVSERSKPADPVRPDTSGPGVEWAPRSVDAETLLATAAGAEGIERFLIRRRRNTAEMNGILRRLLLAQLSTAGFFREPVRRELVGAGIASELKKWLDASVTALLDGGELVLEGNLLRPCNGEPDIESVWQEWREWRDAQAGDPEWVAKAAVTERTIQAMPAILAGKQTATAVLFPGGSFDLVESIYNGNVASDYFNCALSEGVRTEVERLCAVSRPGIRILEVGAGTGSASRWVLDGLAGFESAIAEYCYTDVSKAFLIEAEKRFSHRAPYLTYAIFDAERSPGDQGFAVGQYDIVIANNVLHATKDIVKTVEHVHELLQPRGALLLNELTGNEWWAHLAFGFLDGWFRHTDQWRIEGGPALSSASWREVLSACGFGEVHFPTAHVESLGMQVVRARAGSSATSAEIGQTEPESSLETHIEDAIARCLTASLKLRQDELVVDVPFADYGLDSLTSVNLVRMLGQSLGTDLDPSILFDNPSIRRLTKYLVSEHGATIAAHKFGHGKDAGAPESKLASAALDPDEPANIKSLGADKVSPSRAVPRSREPIAIIGMSGRFPGARDLDEFWRQMIEGHDPVTQVSRWNISDKQSQCLHGGFLDDIDEFDPLFFGISGLEAGYMDPQQRLFLQEAWNALEDAGYASESIDRERCGVYVGCGDGDYFDLMTPSEYPAQAYWGNMYSMVPARLAYYLDLHGPALTVNTACSSSLMAVYLACQGLWAHEADLTLAGGVAVQCSPRAYIAGSRAGMLSPSGRCHTFDRDADGFVPAEGVGVLVLKRLSDAEADGDHVYGVIRGIGANQDGTSNGITAPNGSSQERLIRKILSDSEIDAGTIQMVEAHGTGTKLGDPVEFNALVRAFGSTDKTEFCSLGSVKANIGHTLEAAGVAGIIKILLAMKHGMMPGLLHYRTANPSITLPGSPFYVHSESREWGAPHDGKRRAAVTSLGASGTNVHAIIEQAPAVPPRVAPSGPLLIAVSGRTPAALRERVARLVRFCEENRDTNLGDLSYTLLLGRMHFEYRWACLVDDMADLENRLTAWLTGERGGITSHAIAAAYLDGQTPDFTELFRNGHYRRVPLPGYPFERSRYTLPSEAFSVESPAGRAPDPTVLTGDEFYVREHRVRGQALVPGAMYLQWAHEAVHRAGGVSPGDAVYLHDIAFLRPLVVSEVPRVVSVAFQSEGSQTRFEVRSAESAADTSDNPLVHCQGGFSHSGRPVRRTLDLPAMLRNFQPTGFDRQHFYNEYRDMDIDFGPALQGCVAVYEADGELLARLRLPEVVADTAGSFALHPVLVDSAMQCMRLLAAPQHCDHSAGVVFSVKEVEILGPSTENMWAWLRRGDGSDAGRINIDLADDSGTVRLTLRGVLTRGLESATGVGAHETAVRSATVLLPAWEEAREAKAETWPRISDSVGILAATQDARDVLAAIYPSAHMLAVPPHASLHDIEHALRSAPMLDHLFWVAPQYAETASAESMIGGQQAGVLQVLRTVQAALAAGYGNRALGWTVITNRAHGVHESEGIDPTHASVAGLAGSVAKEYPNWSMRVVDVDVYDASALSAVLSLPADPDGTMCILRNGTSYRQQFLRVQAAQPKPSRFRDGGTYIILGGAGGLGSAISEHLIRHYRAQVVWLGRRPHDARIDAAIARAAGSTGPEPYYIRADATSAENLWQARSEIEQRFGNVHGLIHSGLVFSGQSLVKMTETEFHEVLQSKVDASVRLLDVFGSDSLDIVLFLSSINSYLKAVKQANYAAACTFMDSFAHTVESRYGCLARVLNLGYCFNNAVDGSDYSTLMGKEIPLIQPDELMTTIELLCASSTAQLTLMKFGQAMNTRGLTVGEDGIHMLPAEHSPSPDVPPTPRPESSTASAELTRLRERVAALTALQL